MTPELDFRVLGPVCVLNGDAPVAMGGTKRRSVLALLVSAANHVVSTASLVDAVWEDHPPPSAASSLQVTISALRTALGGTGGQAAIQTMPPGYRLALGPEQSDLQRFHARRADATRALAKGDLAAASDLLRSALDEWSGRAYDDLAGLRFADDLAARLEQERLTTLEARVEADLRLGRHRSLVSELAGLTSEEPLRESLWAHYMLSLYRSGRQADALAAYRQLRGTLMDELGLEPGADLRRLEARILEQNPALDWSATEASPAMVTERDHSTLDAADLVDEAGGVVPIPAGGLRIGRDPANDLVLDQSRVSRHHATVLAGAAGYVVADLHSTNGTRVNGELVLGERLLAEGDSIQVGDMVLTLRLR